MCENSVTTGDSCKDEKWKSARKHTQRHYNRAFVGTLFILASHTIYHFTITNSTELCAHKCTPHWTWDEKWKKNLVWIIWVKIKLYVHIERFHLSLEYLHAIARSEQSSRSIFLIFCYRIVRSGCFQLDNMSIFNQPWASLLNTWRNEEITKWIYWQNVR